VDSATSDREGHGRDSGAPGRITPSYIWSVKQV
jgi:hypothetical protein